MPVRHFPRNDMKLSRFLPLLVVTALASGLLSVLGMPDDAGKAAPALSEGFTFVQMCDTQLGMGGYEHDVKTFELAVAQINALAPDFFLICGDLVGKANDKSWADFNRIKAGFKIPCHCAAGNHEGIQMVHGETTSRNFDKRPLGFRMWTARENGRMSHEFVKLAGDIPKKK